MNTGTPPPTFITLHLPTSNIDLLDPLVTPSPSPCSSSNEVFVQLSTMLVIPDYKSFYAPTPINSFQPVYRSLADGSLISPPFDGDLISANLTLFVVSGLAVVFTRNIFVSGDYIRRGKVKRKTLFWILFVSQMLAPSSLIPIILSYFVQSINCSIVVILSSLSAMISLALLITGILGVKAYKCLDNPRLMVIALALLQAGSTAVVVLDLIKTGGTRRLSGSCVQVNNLTYTRYFVSIQFFQSLFICCCFVYASWKSHGSSAARGRISVRLSMDDLQIQIPFNPEDEQPMRRGWWDYAPNNQNSSATLRKPRANIYIRKMNSKVFEFFSRKKKSKPREPESLDSEWKSSPEVKPPVTSIVKISEPFSSDVGRESMTGSRGRYSPAFSSGSRLSRLIPRMELFREVLKDELLYTTFITSTCVVVAILSIIGVNFKTCLSVYGWISLNWAIISLLAIHSFGRVVHRHEREAWIQQSACRTGLIRAATNFSIRQSRRTRTRTPSTVPSRNRSTHEGKDRPRGDPDDPFSETRPLDQERFSWKFGTITPSPMGSQSSSPVFSCRDVSSVVISNHGSDIVVLGRDSPYTLSREERYLSPRAPFSWDSVTIPANSNVPTRHPRISPTTM